MNIQFVSTLNIILWKQPSNSKTLGQVLMCGDGANDCSAIALAHIGISFSESDASYTAPFSSKTTSLSCCVKVLAQGKAAILIIIEVFQYTLSVNGIKFISVILMLWKGKLIPISSSHLLDSLRQFQQ